MLTADEQDRLFEVLGATMEVMGQEYTPAALLLMVSDLSAYPLNETQHALARCRSEVKGRLTLASIVERIPSANAHASTHGGKRHHHHQGSDGVIQVFVPYLGPSLNSIYAGVHWATRKKHADAAHRATQIAACGLEPITRPVQLTLQPVLGKGKRRLDCSNYGYTLKLIEDGLVRSGLLKRLRGQRADIGADPRP